MTDARKTGKVYDFHSKLSVTKTDFASPTDGYVSDVNITFPTQGVLFSNEGSGIVEYSFNGFDIHGELDSSKTTKDLMFNSRVVSLIWFRVKTGSTGPIVVRVDAWGTR